MSDNTRFYDEWKSSAIKSLFFYPKPTTLNKNWTHRIRAVSLISLLFIICFEKKTTKKNKQTILCIYILCWNQFPSLIEITVMISFRTKRKTQKKKKRQEKKRNNIRKERLWNVYTCMLYIRLLFCLFVYLYRGCLLETCGVQTLPVPAVCLFVC